MSSPPPDTANAPVLLLGAGAGEATCGILYLASYLRRGGIEAYVRLYDGDASEEEIRRSLSQLISHLRPRVVGISLKWFHHVARALVVAKALRKIDPELRIVLGGNTASYFWQELISWDCVDHIVLGDGEAPLLALCRGEASPPNVVTRLADGTARRPPFSYVQSVSSDDIYYSHFDDIFLSRQDLSEFSGWVAPGKGCAENCNYCGGGRGVQKTSFGRAKPFLRPAQSVREDHREIVGRTWQLRYDFAGSTSQFLESTWAGVDLSRHSTTYFLWGVPPTDLVDSLVSTFQRVFMVLDIGCFSELQRQDLMRRGQLKPCPSDRELLEIIDACHHKNLQVEISGIAGLPYASEATLAQERRLVEKVLSLGCVIGYQRLEAQPGAPVTEHPERFDMVSEATTFKEFLAYFQRGDASLQGTVPMVRFRDPGLEAAVQRTSRELEELGQRHAARKRLVPIQGRTRLLNTSPSSRQLDLGEWLGSYRVPRRERREKVTVVRSVDGAGLACAPSVDPERFFDSSLEQGEAAQALLSVLGAFERPTTVDHALGQLRSKARLHPDSAREVIEHLAGGRFLQPA